MKLTLEQARVKANKTAQDMADELGVNIDTYLRMEKYPGDLTYEQGLEVASAVGLTIEDLTFQNESK